MATEAAHGTAHAPKDDGAVHSHISSTGFYVAIFMALIGLTILTVGQSYVDLGRMNLIVVILIATTKASLVVTFFMHLRHDNKFNALIFVSCIFFIGIFFAYTMNDTERRGELDPDQNVKVLQKTGEAAPGGYVPHSEKHEVSNPNGTHDETGKGGAIPNSSAAPTAAPAQHH